MMKSLAVTIVLSLLSAALFTVEVEARPLGGKKSVGMKRDSAQQNTATPPSAPAQNAVAPKPVSSAVAPAAAAPSGMSKWMGPLAGLAAGGLLASLFMGGGFGGIKMFDILLLVGLAFGAFMIWRMLAAKKAATASGANSMEYAGASPEPHAPAAFTPSPAPLSTAPSSRPLTPEIGSRLADGNASVAAIETATISPRIPADFEVEPFLRQGRVAFIRLQAANDARDLNDIRDFTTPEMYAELAMQIQERGNITQRTEIVTMDAKLLEVVTEVEAKGRRMIASVRFTGRFRDGTDPVESLDEVWHVTKQLDDPQSTWLLAGIQQVE